MSDKVEPRDVPEDVGDAETLPGQTEVVAGTPEHDRVLTSYPNATSYGPDVNVVLPPEEPPPPEVLPERDEGPGPDPNPLLTDDHLGDEAGRE